jgi:hypothetical protein
VAVVVEQARTPGWEELVDLEVVVVDRLEPEDLEAEGAADPGVTLQAMADLEEGEEGLAVRTPEEPLSSGGALEEMEASESTREVEEEAPLSEVPSLFRMERPSHLRPHPFPEAPSQPGQEERPVEAALLGAPAPPRALTSS